jgi:hypothetical protein
MHRRDIQSEYYLEIHTNTAHENRRRTVASFQCKTERKGSRVVNPTHAAGAWGAAFGTWNQDGFPFRELGAYPSLNVMTEAALVE